LADIFLSYAREDHARAEQIATALTAAGYDVFWDVNIPPGKTWADILEQKLAAAKAAIVLWSKNSTTSKWVREEARLARDQGKLLPVLIDESPPPFGFGEIQSADLKNWQGDADDDHWLALLGALASAVGSTSEAPKPEPFATAPPTPKPSPPARSWRRFITKRRVITAAVGLFLLYFVIGPIVSAIPLLFKSSSDTAVIAPAPTDPMPSTDAKGGDDNYGGEGVDFGIPETAELRTEVRGATPISIPGAHVFYTDDIVQMIRLGNVLLIDVLEGDHDTIMDAIRMPGVGQGGSFNDAVQNDLRTRLARATEGDKAQSVVFFCAGVHCWESYNAALRARALGYTQVGWYRGGLQAWRDAGLAMRKATRNPDD